MTDSRTVFDRLCTRGKEFLGIEYPILGGAMSWISESNLVSAISEAGGFGVLAGGLPPRDAISKVTKSSSKLLCSPPPSE